MTPTPPVFSAVQVQTKYWAVFRLQPAPEDEMGVPEFLQQIIRSYPTRRDEVWDIEAPIVGRALDQMDLPDDRSDLNAFLELAVLVGTVKNTTRFEGLLRSPDPGVQRAAIRSTNADHSSRLIPFLTDPNLELRRAAIVALGLFGPPEAQAAIQATRSAETASVIDLIATQKAAFEAQDWDSFADSGLKLPEYEDLGTFITYVRPRLTTILESKRADPVLRERAARLLGLTRTSTAVDLFADIAEDESEPPQLRAACAIATGRCCVETRLPSLIRLEKHADRQISEAARRGLAEFGEGLIFYRPPMDQQPSTPTASKSFRLPNGPQFVKDWLENENRAKPDRIYWFDQAGNPMTLDSGDIIEDLLRSTNTVARSNGIFLAALQGGNRETLRGLAQSDPDNSNRNLASTVLEKVPGQ
jgi:hypothetical protein